MLDLKVLIQAGLGRLKLQPEVFWNCTPAEILALMGKTLERDAMTRGRLETLMSAFPDKKGPSDE